MRIGMGVMKRGMPAWIAKLVPDAPSIASRFFTVSEDGSTSPATLHLNQIPLPFHPGKDFDLLATAGGDRLWKLIWNLATGGESTVSNLSIISPTHTTQTYRIESHPPALPSGFGSGTGAESRTSNRTLRKTLKRASRLSPTPARRMLSSIEVQPVDSSSASFKPIATIRFERELDIDQEALHFYPFSGRGFEPYGFFTGLRRCVYPASVQSRPHDRLQRAQREHRPFRRFIRYWSEIPTGPLDVEKEGQPWLHPSSLEIRLLESAGGFASLFLR